MTGSHISGKVCSRRLHKNKQVVAAWTQHGNVLIRKSENDRPIEITCYENLQEIVLGASEQEIEEHIPINNSDVSLGSESLKSHISDMRPTGNQMMTF